MAGGDVIECESVWVVVRSLHPQKYPGVSQLAVVEENDAGVVDVGSLQPNHPGVLQVVVAVLVGELGVLVAVACEVLLVVVVVSSLHPNHPGVLHVEVDVVVVVLVLVAVPVVVVVSSRHPHHPGVWHVDVRVFVLVVDVVAVVLSLLLPVTSFHNGQS
jgi:hypothetical protein